MVKQTSDSEPIATHARVALKLPPTLASLYDPKYKNLSYIYIYIYIYIYSLISRCESVFKNLTVSIDEAKYLEESTRLQSQSTLWFNHRAGRVTASKFATVSKASLNPPPTSLI